MELNTSELKEKAKTLRAGDKIELSGTVYTARDAAHKRIKQLIDEGGELPFEIDGAAIYYAGPTGTKEGMAIGSCGPTTSGRMDPYAPLLLDMGLSAMIGNACVIRSYQWVISACRSRRHKTQRCGILLCHRRCRCTCLSVHNRV